MNTIRELALHYSKSQPKQVDWLTENAPILDSMTFEPSTHGLKHAYEVLDEVTGGGFVNIDASLPDVDATSNLNWKELSIIGGIHRCGEDKAKMLGGFNAYLAKKLPKIIKKTGMNAETAIIYNILMDFAHKNGKLVSATSSQSGNKYLSILAVRWEEGEMGGLYDPNGFGNPNAGTDGLLDVLPISGGNLYEHDSRLKYGARIKSYFGTLAVNPQNIAGIVNIDSTAVAPDTLAGQMDTMLAEARVGSGGRTVIYMHQKTLTKLVKFKASQLIMTPPQTDINRVVASWNGTPIVTSYNFKDGTESPLTIA